MILLSRHNDILLQYPVVFSSDYITSISRPAKLFTFCVEVEEKHQRAPGRIVTINKPKDQILNCKIRHDIIITDDLLM